LVLELYNLPPGSISLLPLLGIDKHVLDFILREAPMSPDGDLVILPRKLVLGCHLKDPIGIHGKGDQNLRYSSFGMLNATENELTYEFVL
jgi:hypothetical protein